MDLDTLELPKGPPHECPYLPDREARDRAFLIEKMPFGLYRLLMDHGWRRSGKIVYRPACDGCQACVPIRIPVWEFQPDRTQRKLQRRNHDIQAKIQEPEPTREKFDLFVRYQQARHRGDMCTEWSEYCQFLYETPLQSREAIFHLDGRVVAVTVFDVESDAISSVYTYYEPDEEMNRRSLGTWVIMWLNHYACLHGLAYHYLGYYIEDCRKMNYKTAFRPCELGDGNGGWRRLNEQ
ncbi:arginyltransferase [bacterium]|nr:arginyltransferase [bacterium]